MANEPEPYGVPLDDEEDEELNDEEESGEDDESSANDSGFDRPKKKLQKKEADEGIEAGESAEASEAAAARGAASAGTEGAAGARTVAAGVEASEAAVATGAAVAAAPEAAAVGAGLVALGIILLLMIVLLVLGFVFADYYLKHKGTDPLDPRFSPQTNQQDRYHLQDIKCLDIEIKRDKDGNGKLPNECAKAIQNWSRHLVANAETLKKKLPTTADGDAARHLLDAVITSGLSAKGVSSQTDIKTAGKLREAVIEAATKANENPLIKSLSPYSENAQKIIDIVKSQPAGTCKQTTGTNCGDTADGIVTSNFPGATHSAYTAFGGLVPDLPTDQNLEDLRTQLEQGNIPIWQVRGNGSGKHFITILGIDEGKNITYFDPADGGIHSDPYDVQGAWGPYFGTPTVDKLGTTNQPIRGYFWIVP
ncbi:MAG: hypothetical protein AAB701_01600 [Patescibacteria group bacterium]